MQRRRRRVARLAGERWGSGRVERQDVAWRHRPRTCRRSRGRGTGPGRQPDRDAAPVRLRSRLAEAGVAEGLSISTRKPEWLRPKVHLGPEVLDLKRTIRSLGLVTVCEDAGCPNLSECWADGTATFMVLGERCTRACGFCLVDTRQPEAPAPTSRSGSLRRSSAWPSTTPCSRWWPATIWPTEGWPTSPRASRRSGPAAGDAGRDAHLGRPRRRGVARDAVRVATGRAQPQHGDGRPAAAGRATVGRLRPQPLRAVPCEGCGAGHQVRVDGRSRRDRRRGRGLPRRPRVDRRRHRDDRPVPPADVAPHPGRPVGRAASGSRHGPRIGESLGIGHVEASPLTRSSYHARSAAAAALDAARRAAADHGIDAARAHSAGDARDPAVYRDRSTASDRDGEQGIDVLMLSVGHDLPYLTGYLAMPLERLTMLVVPRDGDATLVIPGSRRPGSWSNPGCSRSCPGTRPTTRSDSSPSSPPAPRPWRSATRCGPASWSSCCRICPARRTDGRVDVVGPLRMRQGRRRDRRAARGGCGGRSRRGPAPRRRDPARRSHRGRGVARTSAARLIAEGHEQGQLRDRRRRRERGQPPSPRSVRVIREGEIVLCDFGGTMDGYCSDITRCVFTRRAAGGGRRGLRRAPRGASRPPVAAATVGTSCEDVDRAARAVIADAGFGELLHPPHGTRHRSGGARGSVHRGGQRRSRWPPVTRSASSPASTSPDDGGCASRTSSSPRRRGRIRSIVADHDLVAL